MRRGAPCGIPNKLPPVLHILGCLMKMYCTLCEYLFRICHCFCINEKPKNLLPYAVEIVLSIFFKLRLYVVDLGIQALGYLSFCMYLKIDLKTSPPSLVVSFSSAPESSPPALFGCRHTPFSKYCCCILITVDGERSTDNIDATCFTLTRTPSSSSTWPRASPSTLSNKSHISQKKSNLAEL